MDANQLGAFSKDEIALLTQFIKSRLNAAILLRNHFLQLPLNEEEQAFLRSLSPETLQIIERVMMPHLSPETPLAFEATMFSRLAFIEQYSTEGAYLHVATNDLIVKYFEQQLRLLSNVEPIEIDLHSLPLVDDEQEVLTTFDEKERRVMKMMAYNKIIPLIGERVLKIQMMGNPPVAKTPEELAKIATQDSNR